MTGSHARCFDLPRLDEPYWSAAIEAVDALIARFDPIGLLIGGTVVRGEGSPNSDLDFVLIHTEEWRQRVQRSFRGIPIEVFVSPAHAFRASMDSEVVSGLPSMMGFARTAVIVLDKTGVMADLQREAEDLWAAGPMVPNDHLHLTQHQIVNLIDDAEDTIGTDVDRAVAFLNEAITLAVQAHFIRHGQWIPRRKVLLSELDRHDPALGRATRRVLEAARIQASLHEARTVIQALAGESTNFAWDSLPEPTAPPKAGP